MWIKDYEAGIFLSAVNIDKALDYPCFVTHTSSGIFELYSNNCGKPSLSYSFSYPFSLLQDGNDIWLFSVIFPVVTVQAVKRNYMWTVNL